MAAKKKVQLQKKVQLIEGIKPVVSSDTFGRIVLAIKASGVSGPAAMEGARLTEAWIRETAKFDAQFPTIAAELPFFILLEKYTVVVGVMDRIALGGPAGIFGCEWKTTKGTTRFWNEEKWLEQIKMGPQLSVYGLAMHEGNFVVPAPWMVHGQWPIGSAEVTVGELGGPTLWHPHNRNPHLLVRAITKEDPPQLWGVDPLAFFEIPKKRLDTIRESLLLKADQIRVARTRKSIPWAVPGLHCQDRFHFGAMCRFYDKYCAKGEHPPGDGHGGAFNEDDPGSKGLKAAESLLRVPLTDERVVVLSASAYSDHEECAEMYRLTAIEGSEEDPELAKGTAFHAGAAEWYRVE